MTNQEVFDKVAMHLLTQKRMAIQPNSQSCQYRTVVKEADGTETTLKCAIGCLIPDDVYSPAMEGSRVYTLIRNYNEVSNILLDLNDNMLADLQTVHDCRTPLLWKHELETVAHRYKLATTILEKF